MGPSERDLACADLLADLARVCGVLNMAHAQLVALTAQAIDQDLWSGWGIRSVEHFLCWQTGLSPWRAKQIVAAARRFDELPVTMGRFTAGELSVDQVVAVAQRIPAHNDEQVAEFATCATVSQLRTSLCKQLFSAPQSDPATDRAALLVDDPRPDGLPEPVDAAQDPATMSMGYDGSRFWLHLDAPADQGAVVWQAVVEARDRLFATNPTVTWADAVTDVCSRSLASASAPRRDRYRVLVHLDTVGGWVNKGPAVPPALLRKLLCDGTVKPLWETEGRPVNVGRGARIVPDHTRRLIEDRDRECLFPGCHASRHLEVHHLLHWADGGPTDTWNLGCLCDAHHDGHHRGDFTLTGNADLPASLRFVDRNGAPIRPVGRPALPVGPLPEPAPGHEYRHPVGEPIQKQWLYFPPPPDAPRRGRPSDDDSHAFGTLQQTCQRPEGQESPSDTARLPGEIEQTGGHATGPAPHRHRLSRPSEPRSLLDAGP